MAKPKLKDTDDANVKEAVMKSSDADDDNAALTQAIENQTPVPPTDTDRDFDKSAAIALLREGQRYAQHALTKIAMPEYGQWIKKVSEFLVSNG
jgi:hypothetical protein